MLNQLLPGDTQLSGLFTDMAPAGLIAGVDEAGRGPLAGPVVAAAVILPAHYDLPFLNDSKKLPQSKREKLFDQISEQALCFAIARADVAEIDNLNILQASLLAMKRAVDALSVPPDIVLVDGNRCPCWSYRSLSVTGGDARVASIAAASILAKVTRDRELIALDDVYPAYGFAGHKGYPTPVHLQALRQHGPSPVHRTSFAPVAALIKQTQTNTVQA